MGLGNLAGEEDGGGGIDDDVVLHGRVRRRLPLLGDGGDEHETKGRRA